MFFLLDKTASQALQQNPGCCWATYFPKKIANLYAKPVSVRCCLSKLRYAAHTAQQQPAFPDGTGVYVYYNIKFDFL